MIATWTRVDCQSGVAVAVRMIRVEIGDGQRVVPGPAVVLELLDRPDRTADRIGGKDRLVVDQQPENSRAEGILS